MANSETISLHQQAEKLQEWRDGFQAVYVIATGVEAGFFVEVAFGCPHGGELMAIGEHCAFAIEAIFVFAVDGVVVGEIEEAELERLFGWSRFDC